MRWSFIIGGISTLGAGVAAMFASKRTADTVKNAVNGMDKDGNPVLPPGSGVTFPVRVTGYWPSTARPDEMKMEGGQFGAAVWGEDRHRVVDPSTGKQIRLHTLEDFQAGNAPYVSVSGDYTIFPFGQRISLAEWPGVVFRIVDTGSHFHGAKKLVRIVGREPLDVDVYSSATKVIPKTDATLYPGDHFDKAAAEVAMARLGKPPVVVGLASDLDLLGAEGV